MLAGKWQGRLEVAPGTTLTIQIVIAAEPGGKYSVVLTSPDDGAIKNVSATKVEYADNRLVVDVLVRRLEPGHDGIPGCLPVDSPEPCKSPRG
jgi:hypothetical protein